MDTFAVIASMQSAIAQLQKQMDELLSAVGPTAGIPAATIPPPVVMLPTDAFDEEFYLAQNPDVAAQVGPPPKPFPTGYSHYLQWGKMEGRAPHAATLPGITYTPAGQFYSAYRAHADNDFSTHGIPKGFDITPVDRSNTVRPYPRVEVVAGGAKVLLKAPVNERFGGSGGTVGDAFARAGLTLWDSSNAPEGERLRSDNGWPLFYPIGGDGKPTGAPRLVYGSNTFASEADIESYIVRTTETPESKAEAAKQWAEWDERFKKNIADHAQAGGVVIETSTPPATHPDDFGNEIKIEVS